MYDKGENEGRNLVAGRCCLVKHLDPRRDSATVLNEDESEAFVVACHGVARCGKVDGEHGHVLVGVEQLPASATDDAV